MWTDDLKANAEGCMPDEIMTFLNTHGPMLERVGREGFVAFVSRAHEQDENAMDEISDRLIADEFVHKIASNPAQKQIWNGMVASFCTSCRAIIPTLETVAGQQLLTLML